MRAESTSATATNVVLGALFISVRSLQARPLAPKFANRNSLLGAAPSEVDVHPIQGAASVVAEVVLRKRRLERFIVRCSQKGGFSSVDGIASCGMQ